MAAMAAKDSQISAHLAVRPDWLASRREEALEPDLPIVDPHHHLIDRPESGTYLLPDLLADIDSGHNIVATVYLEWLSMYRADGPVEMRPVGEIEFANGVAAMAASGGYGKTRVCAGIVGHADLTLGAPREEGAGGDDRGGRRPVPRHPLHRVHGSRSGAVGGHGRPADGPAARQKVREGFAQLAPLGLSFDAWVYHPQLGDVVDLARAFPQTPICLNHVGGAIGLGRYKGKRDAVFADWSARIQRAGGVPQRACEAGRPRHEDVRLRRARGQAAAELRAARDAVAALYRDLHRGLRSPPRDVRKQLPGRQGLLRLRRVLERLQATGAGRECRREGRPVPRHRVAILSPRHLRESSS